MYTQKKVSQKWCTTIKQKKAAFFEAALSYFSFSLSLKQLNNIVGKNKHHQPQQQHHAYLLGHLQEFV